MSGSTSTVTNVTGKLTAAAVRRSEWIKFRSMRSTKALLATMFGFAAVLGPVQTLGQVLSKGPAPETSGADFTASLALSGVSSAAIAAGVMGVLLVTNEFTTGQMQTTLVAVPRRALLVIAKATVTAIAVAVTALAATAVAVIAAVRILDAGDLVGGLSAPVGARVALGAAAYLVVWGLLGQALAWLTRSALGAAMALLGLMFVAPALIGIIPVLGPATSRWLPSEVALGLMRVEPGDGGLGPVVSIAVTGAYLVAALILASVAVGRRDMGGGAS